MQFAWLGHECDSRDGSRSAPSPLARGDEANGERACPGWLGIVVADALACALPSSELFILRALGTSTPISAVAKCDLSWFDPLGCAFDATLARCNDPIERVIPDRPFSIETSKLVAKSR